MRKTIAKGGKTKSSRKKAQVKMMNCSYSMQDIDFMLVHALRQFIMKRVAQSVGDWCELLLSDQVVVDAVLVVKRVIVHTRFCRDKIGDCLGVLACDNWVIKLEVVKSLAWVLKVELDHFNAVSEGVEGHFDSLGDRDELLFVILEPVSRVQGKWAQVPRQCFLVF